MEQIQHLYCVGNISWRGTGKNVIVDHGIWLQHIILLYRGFARASMSSDYGTR